MNAFKIYQQQLRQQKRTQQLQKFKANSRNALLYFPSSNICSLCSDDRWTYNINNQHTITLVFTIFKDGQVCHQHTNLLLQKTKQSLLEVPKNYRRIMAQAESIKDTKRQVIRKIILLLELLDENLLNLNEKLIQQIKDSFDEKDNFILHLMDCAYGYCQWPIEEEGLGDEQWHYEIKALSFQTLLSILTKLPFLICGFLKEYPLEELLSKTNTSNRLHLYESMSLFFYNCSINAIKYQSTILQIECCLANHLQNIRSILVPNQVIDGLASWIQTMLSTGLPFQCITLSLIIEFLQSIRQLCDSKAGIIDLLNHNYAIFLQMNTELKKELYDLSKAQICSSPMEVEE